MSSYRRRRVNTTNDLAALRLQRQRRQRDVVSDLETSVRRRRIGNTAANLVRARRVRLANTDSSGTDTCDTDTDDDLNANVLPDLEDVIRELEELVTRLVNRSVAQRFITNLQTRIRALRNIIILVGRLQPDDAANRLDEIIQALRELARLMESRGIANAFVLNVRNQIRALELILPLLRRRRRRRRRKNRDDKCHGRDKRGKCCRCRKRVFAINEFVDTHTLPRATTDVLRVINVTFSDGSMTAIKIMCINFIVRLTTGRDNTPAVDIYMNDGRAIRGKFNSAERADQFYDELRLAMSRINVVDVLRQIIGQ